MQPKIHRSATTYIVQNSISDTLIPISYISSCAILGQFGTESRARGARNTCLSVYANQRIPAAPMTTNRALPWLPKKSSNPLDEAQKPYYCGISHHHQRRLA